MNRKEKVAACGRTNDAIHPVEDPIVPWPGTAWL